MRYIHFPTRNKYVVDILVGVQYRTIFGSHQLKIKGLVAVRIDRVNVFNKIRCLRSFGCFLRCHTLDFTVSGKTPGRFVCRKCTYIILITKDYSFYF